MYLQHSDVMTEAADDVMMVVVRSRITIIKDPWYDVVMIEMSGHTPGS